MSDASRREARGGRLISGFFTVATKFWTGSSRRRALLLSGGFLGALVLNMLLAVAVNQWSKYFFDAIQNKNGGAIRWSLAIILALGLGTALASVMLVQSRMRLQLRWRQWLSRRLISRWLEKRRFYQLGILGSIDNPEARIAEDTRISVELLVDLAGGIINTFLISASFIFVLWQIGGSLTIAGLTIPGYLVIAVVCYTALTTFGMYKLGRPLVARVEDKAAREGDFRYALTRVRENAEAIALIGGDEDERRLLDHSFNRLATRWVAVIACQARMMFLSSGNNILAAAVPLLLCAPKYLAGEMSLGDLMQAAAAFAQVQSAMNWLADNALSLANWSASARRVAELDEALGGLDTDLSAKGASGISTTDSPDGSLRLVSLTVARHDGVVMLADANARIAMGDKVLVRGDSGSGKSSLIRAIAGLWPWGTGHIVSPLAGRRIAFMPQRPYLPLGSLRMALLYPRDGARVDDVDIKRALVDCGLAHLLPRLDEEQNWSNILSGGELQRLAFARTFLKNPDVIIMDEATSALDETSQRKMMDMMTSRQAHSMVVHVAHRPGLERYHSRELVLTRDRDMPARLSEPDKTIQYVEARSSTRPRRANSPDVTSTVAAIISDARKPNPALLELDEAPVPRRALARG